jgi:hypothetical protein
MVCLSGRPLATSAAQRINMRSCSRLGHVPCACLPRPASRPLLACDNQTSSLPFLFILDRVPTFSPARCSALLPTCFSPKSLFCRLYSLRVPAACVPARISPPPALQLPPWWRITRREPIAPLLFPPFLPQVTCVPSLPLASTTD